MNHKHVSAALALTGAGIIVLAGFGEAARVRQAEQAKRAQIREDAQLDIAAIHNATDVVAQQLVDGKITSLAQLSQRVNEEIAFQKIVIREETKA